jgi:DNA-directed RNA polymerase specialized sigma24 family protein
VVNKQHSDKTRLTPKQLEALALQEQGLTYWEIADRLGITEDAVSKRLTKARMIRVIENDTTVTKIDKIRTELTPQEAEAVELQRQGFTYQQIAEKLHIVKGTVQRRLKSARLRQRVKEHLKNDGE